MTIATLVVYGRYWYDFLTIAWIVAFFLIEMLLLYRNSVIGWAMTAKCLTLAVVFGWALLNPPPVLLPESVTVGAVVVRLLLVAVLGFVIAVLVWMRLHQEVVVVGKEGDVRYRSGRDGG